MIFPELQAAVSFGKKSDEPIFFAAANFLYLSHSIHRPAYV